MYRVVRAGDPDGIGGLLPAGVVAVEAIGPVAPDPLFAEEESLVARAVEIRRLDVARGRSCARRALAELGIAPVAIPAGADRAPVWPPGVIGSITHCRDYCCAALAYAARWSTIGIDAEVVKDLEPGVERLILRDAERRWVATQDPATRWSCVVFSIKEASYKAWYPVVRRVLDFHDVEVGIDVVSGEFTAEIVDTGSTLTGRYQLRDGLVMAVAMMQPQPREDL